MAEMILWSSVKRPPPAYQDGDILHCFTNRRIRWTWAEEICAIRHFGFTLDGLRPPSLAWKYRQHTHRYRFIRVSRNEVERYDTVTGLTELFSERPNHKGHYIHLAYYLRQRVVHPHHVIFGTPGHEEWYGGHKDFSNPAMDRIWQDIEADSVYQEKNFLNFPLSPREKQITVVFSIPDLSDLEASRYERIVQVPLDGEAMKIVYKREFYVPYWELPFVNIENSRANDVTTDYRKHLVEGVIPQSNMGVLV